MDIKMERKYGMPVILEQFSMSKSGRQEENEDLIYIDEKYIAVIDGATGKNDAVFCGKTGGQWSADLAAQALRGCGGHETAETVIEKIQQDMRRFLAENRTMPDELELCASAVIYSIFHRQIWSVGDCQYRVDGKLTDNKKKVDDTLGQARALAIRCLLLEGMKEEELLANDLGRQAILPFLKKQKLLENADGEFGYPVLNGRGAVTGIGLEDIAPGTMIVLASDGYPYLENTLRESEDRLAELLREDPLCYKKFCSTKGLKKGNVSFDDRTYVRFLTT